MRAIIVGLFACLIAAAPLQAGPYPDRPIAIVVPFGKGTTADLVAAVVAEAMSKNIGQKVVVELKPGAGGGIAMEQAEKALPDGYSLAMITQGPGWALMSLLCCVLLAKVTRLEANRSALPIAARVSSS